MNEWEIERNITKKLDKEQILDNEQLTIELAKISKKVNKLDCRADEHGSALWFYFALIVITIIIYALNYYKILGC